MVCRIPVTFLTYKRAEYLEATIESFLTLNKDILDRFMFFIHVQGRDKPTNIVVSKYSSRFVCIDQVRKNQGCAAGYSRVMASAMRTGTEFLIHIQDDWGSREPLTEYLEEVLDFFTTPAFYDVGMMRLRTIKERVSHRHRMTKKGIKWERVTPNISVSNAHWTLNPHIVRSSVLEKMLPITMELDAMSKYWKLGMRSAQLMADCFTHIGAERAWSFSKEGSKHWVK